MDKISVPDFIGQLCDLHIGPTQRTHRVQPLISRTEAKRIIKKKAYNALFSYRTQMFENSDFQVNRDFGGILIEVFRMRMKHEYEKADRLEELFNDLLKDNSGDNRQYLRFLLALKGSGDSLTSTQLGKDIFHFPSVENRKKKLEMVPAVPPCYGDTRFLGGFSHFYTHYPREVFEKPFDSIVQEEEKLLHSAFDSVPGRNLGPGNFFTTKFLIGDSHEQTTHDSLFGALVQGRVKGLDVRLSLPDLSSVCQIRIPEFKCSRSPSSTQLSDESGLGSGSASMSSSVITCQSPSGYDDSIWEKALTQPRSDHYTWEWIGYQPGPTERSHLTEAGPGVFDLLVQLRKRVSAIVCPEVAQTQFVKVQPSVLVKHIQLMLIGVPSKYFPFNQHTQSFDITEGLMVSGTSPEMLACFLSEFTDCGTFYARLAHFSQPLVVNSFYTGGVVFQAFAAAVRKALAHFTAAVLNIPSTISLLSLKDYMLRAFDQLRYLAQLCQCHDKPSPEVPPGDFPTGMRLLSYLYYETEMSASSSHYPLLLSILQTSFAPFMLFIRDWVFLGVHRDYYEEFMIHVQMSCVESRDETYWSRAYNLVTERQNGEGIPGFLKDMVHDIVTCGKSINLLRICDPQHFLCNVAESEVPPVIITFSPKDLKATEKYCQAYVGRMRQIAQELTHDRQEALRKLEQQKVELQQTARRIADQHITRLQGIINERKTKAGEKKRVEFSRLKEQMELDLKRRADETEQQKEEDRQFIARITRAEDALTEQEIELEKNATDDLIAYYMDLGKEAMHRERRALWRIRRARLDDVRFQFLMADAKRWAQELQEHREAEDVLDSGSGLPRWAERFSENDPLIVTSDLPRWAERFSENDSPVVLSGHEEITLPAWTQKEIADSENENQDEGVRTEDNATLPSWARRGLQQEPHSETIEVGEDENECSEGAEKDGVGKVHMGRAGLRKLPEKSHSCRESVETHPNKPHICKVEGRGACEESEERTERKSSVKMVDGVSALKESHESEPIAHVKFSAAMYASKESDPVQAGHKPHIKSVAGMQVSKECSEERQIIPKQHRDLTLQHITSETQSSVWVIKKPSMFGHVSQLSNVSYILAVPKLRRQSQQHANMESDFKDFAIRPQIRISKTMSANKESNPLSVPLQPRSHIRILSNRNATLESQPVDANALLIKRFQAHNFRGHSSDSTIQRLLYSDVKQDEPDGILQRIQIKPGLPYQIEQYKTDFGELGEKPNLDLLSHIFVADLGRDLVDTVVSSEEEVEAYKYTPLSILLMRSIITPIRAQITLVNNAVISYFTSKLGVNKHFEAIRRYLLMADGDFAEILANILLEKLATSPLPQEILNPVFLNGALNKAIRSSMHSDDENTQNLSFALKYMPSILMPNAPNSMKCLELRYSVTWPLNVILTNSCMEKYYQVFSFLLQIKRVVWTLKDIWHRLKRDALINKVGNSAQFRHLQLHRQEMEHFVKMMQGYITNQVIHVSWQEFQTSLAQPIAGLDQLHAIHERYVDKALSRCLLDKKAERVMKIIQDIFCLILKFRSQLVSTTWQKSDPSPGEVTHPNFASMVHTYKSFHVYSFFLFKVVNRLSQKGYQPHLQELLLQLNFNDYYSEAAN